jgi:hypothetical protein
MGMYKEILNIRENVNKLKRLILRTLYNFRYFCYMIILFPFLNKYFT